MQFEDIIYEKRDAIAKIIINRPEVLNAIRNKTAHDYQPRYRIPYHPPP